MPEHGTPTALDVAAAIIRMAPERFTHMGLQKTLYYAQGWHLAWTDEPLFMDAIEAWPKGPAVGRVYMAYKQYENRPIPEPTSGDEAALSTRDYQMVEATVRAYENLSAGDLLKLTHEEDPWKVCREGYAPEQRSRRAIPRRAMKNFFRKKGSFPKGGPGLDPKLGELISQGDGRALAQAFETDRVRVASIRRK